MLPSGYVPRGHLIVDYESAICVGGADVRRGTLDGVAVTVKAISNDLTGPSVGGTREARMDARILSRLAYSCRY